MEGVLFNGDTVALVMIKAQLGQAKDVALHVSELAEVHWAVVVTGPYDVIAVVKVGDNRALCDTVVDLIQNTEGVANPTTMVITDLYRAGKREDNDIP